MTLGLRMADLFDRPRAPATEAFGAKRIADQYSYQFEQGKSVFEVLRFEPKDFRQRRLGVDGEYVYNLSGLEKRPLYHQPELAAAIKADAPIYFVEGEKDVERLRAAGLTATTMAGGASAPWQPEYTDALRGALVVLIPDNDAPGRAYVRRVVRALPESRPPFR